MDPAGFALESFDVMGGWRERYRGVDQTKPAEKRLGKNGQPFALDYALPVDSTGVLPDGRQFNDVRELKRLLLTDERQLAFNVARQLTIYATGAPVRYRQAAVVFRQAPVAGYGLDAHTAHCEEVSRTDQAQVGIPGQQSEGAIPLFEFRLKRVVSLRSRSEIGVNDVVVLGIRPERLGERASETGIRQPESRLSDTGVGNAKPEQRSDSDTLGLPGYMASRRQFLGWIRVTRC